MDWSVLAPVIGGPYTIPAMITAMMVSIVLMAMMPESGGRR